MPAGVPKLQLKQHCLALYQPLCHHLVRHETAQLSIHKCVGLYRKGLIAAGSTQQKSVKETTRKLRTAVVWSQQAKEGGTVLFGPIHQVSLVCLLCLLLANTTLLQHADGKLSLQLAVTNYGSVLTVLEHMLVGKATSRLSNCVACSWHLQMPGAHIPSGRKGQNPVSGQAQRCNTEKDFNRLLAAAAFGKLLTVKRLLKTDTHQASLVITGTFPAMRIKHRNIAAASTVACLM